jgi:hypothetical protein
MNGGEGFRVRHLAIFDHRAVLQSNAASPLEAGPRMHVQRRVKPQYVVYAAIPVE